MSAKALWLLGRGFGVQVIVVVVAGLLWAVCAPTVGAKRVRGGDVVPTGSGEVPHLFEAFALLVAVELAAGAVAALIVWIISKPVRGAWLIGAVLAGAFAGSFLAVAVGGAVRSLLYPGPGQGPGAVGQAAARLSEAEADAAAVACALGAAVVLFLAASATPKLGSVLGSRRTGGLRLEDRELVGDPQLAVGEAIFGGGPPAGFDAVPGGDEHAAASEYAGEVRGVHRTV